MYSTYEECLAFALAYIVAIITLIAIGMSDKNK
jgi:hypothetical protein